jgi:hypothetical protein
MYVEAIELENADVPGKPNLLRFNSEEEARKWIAEERSRRGMTNG